jgi:hypothetical protein
MATLVFVTFASTAPCPSFATTAYAPCGTGWREF